jgi:hypothetical protein
MAERSVAMSVQEWFLVETAVPEVLATNPSAATMDECAEDLLDAGFSTNVFRGVAADGAQRRQLQIVPKIENSLPDPKASIGQWVVLVGQTVTILSPDEHAAQFGEET